MYFLQVFQVHMMINFLGVLLEGNVYFVFSNVCSGKKERLLYSQERTFQDLGNQKLYPRQRHTRAVELRTASSRSSAIVTPVSWLAGSSERALRSSTAGISPLDRRSTQPVNTRGSIDAQVPAAEVSSIVWRLSGLRRRMKQ